MIADFELARHTGKSRKQVFEIFGILSSLRKKIKHPEKYKDVVQEIYGYKISGYYFRSLDYLYREIFLNDEYYFKASTDAPVIIDCGANIGFSVLYFARLYPEAKIYAFEPSPTSFALLQKNISDNKLKNVSLYNNALSDTEEEVPFFADYAGSLTGSLRNDRGGTNHVNVKAIRLSDFIKKSDNKIDLLKIDVEGAEIKMLDDLYDTNSLAKIDQLIVEYHHHIVDNEPSRLSGFLKKFEEKEFDYNIRGKFPKSGKMQDLLIRFYHR